MLATALEAVTSQMVHVVSIDDVPIRFGSISFQSKDVSGAQKSEDLFCVGIERGVRVEMMSGKQDMMTCLCTSCR